MTVYGIIYGLYDPMTDILRYVGQTVRTLKARLASHTWEAKRNSNRRLSKAEISDRLGICLDAVRYHLKRSTKAKQTMLKKAVI